MPRPPDHPPDLAAVRRAFDASRPLDWGDDSLAPADIARRYGMKATRKSLELLRRTAEIEPRVTDQFLASIPADSSPYQLSRRVKSPESLARKIRTWSDANNRNPVEDLLRYTVLTESPDQLVASTRSTTEALTDHGWRVLYAMHSYTDGSRYKGVHAHFSTPDIDRLEIQWHSVSSAEVKELTTRWYEAERSLATSDAERTAAREKCVAASAQLSTPAGIDGLTELGGRRVKVKNYSDSRQMVTERQPGATELTRRSTTDRDRGEGIAR
ncbi:hypothetical protein ACFWUU_24405 [Kribbella sp. NPDC058693]|uniref:hypothetical protein n=1 Tax=Kribbella sp. NPDC058693 TaxID=3346602 RepID=UPI0036699002